MPKKSRRSYSFQSKKRKGRQGSSAIAAQQPAVAQTYEPVSSPKAAAPSASMPAPKATVTIARYPHIAAELRRIGILAGIMLVTLIVLALVLP